MTFGHSQKAAVEGLGIGSLFAGGVFLAAQLTVMIQIASAEVLAEPLVALDVIRSQSASLCSIQSLEVWTRRGGQLRAAVGRVGFWAHQIVSAGLILARARRGCRLIFRSCTDQIVPLRRVRLV